MEVEWIQRERKNVFQCILIMSRHNFEDHINVGLSFPEFTTVEWMEGASRFIYKKS